MMVEVVVYTVVLPLLVGAVFLSAVRLAKGPHLLDRVIALDFATVVVVGILGVYAIATDQPVYLDVAVVVALLSFLGTIGFAYYIEQRNRRLNS
jgi:multicomponent Na+:H+ antiporter subunit F